ncbi:MAG: FHA domain-containing protein, partial [Deltaproteobacteria bacterium]
MPSLKVSAPDWQRPRVVSLFKRITTIGSSPDCDVVIGSGGLGPVHANIHFDGNRFTVNAVERRYVVEVNGRKVQAHRLSHGDEIRLGPAVCVFRLYDEPADDEQRRMHEVRLDGLRKMVEF